MGRFDGHGTPYTDAHPDREIGETTSVGRGRQGPYIGYPGRDSSVQDGDMEECLYGREGVRVNRVKTVSGGGGPWCSYSGSPDWIFIH